MLLSLIQHLGLLLQVFATYPNEDYDRRNEDVDPMAASAEYELEKRVERLDLFPVELEKGTEHYKARSLFPSARVQVQVQDILKLVSSANHPFPSKTTAGFTFHLFPVSHTSNIPPTLSCINIFIEDYI